MFYVLRNIYAVQALKYTIPMGPKLVRLLDEHKDQAMWTPHGQLRLRINGVPTTVTEGYYVIKTPNGMLTVNDPMTFKHKYKPAKKGKHY